ncbi:TRAP transporter small permease subunit [Orrella daihaiensis]|uniref:TRAP transporter small permease protein n=2 Tax=Orrella daihaiensis TaxID=2782176 RepID=A0ABY4AR40_9BURK|nr:TRAP transporter small permease subunit [Orrella daihaiensis]
MAQRLSAFVDRVADVTAGVAIVVLVAAVMLQVVARYVFQSPPPWTEELARYAMIWAGLIGATMSFKRRFDPALFSAVPRNPWLAIVAGLIQSLTVLIYLIPILWFTFFGPNMNVNRGFLLRHSRITSETLDITTFWVAIAVPIMIIFILIHLVARWFEPPAPEAHDIEA